jgi:hypothetical protein
MECRAVLNMRRTILLLALLLLSAPIGAASTQQSVVLVVSATSSVTDLDSVTVRKLFLGLPVLVSGRPLHPLRNRSDARLDQIFLQEIVAMSQTAYDRQTLIGVNRQGWQRPEEIDTEARLLEKIYADPNAVTFMWERDVSRNPRVRALRVLWTE